MANIGLFLITGAAGSGKSTVGKHLQSLGYHVVEGNDIAEWVNKDTSEVIAKGESKSTDAAWVEKHYWNWKNDEIQKLVQQSTQKCLFLTGGADNITEHWHLFEKVFLLTVDDETTKNRIQDRTDNPYGKGPGQLEPIYEWKRQLAAIGQERGALAINAQQPVHQVAHDILGNL